MSDDEFDIPEDEIDEMFGQIVATSLEDISTDIEIVDVHLMDGTVFRFHGLSPVLLTNTLATTGMAVLTDNFGKTAILLAQGVAAIIGSAE